LNDQGSVDIARYFSRYPERGGRLSSKVFRRGESERFELLYQWMPNCDGLSVLDAGCGDGAFLRRLLRGHPAQIRLEDIVPKWVADASKTLRDSAGVIEPVVTDIRLAKDAAHYDIVLALGIFDYVGNWPDVLRQLIARSRGTLFADFPKCGTIHSWLRRVWLRLHGIRLHAANRREIDSIVNTPGVAVDLVELPLEWVVRFDCRR
jgi:2-polyprenyl-3-methyl-5-hydroxy-6-metoxy-1,4-benzoquinol methylase